MDNLPPLRTVMQEHGLHPNKALGQHFLFDRNLLDKIVRAAGGVEGKHILEVGPGPGGLTRALLRSDAASVTAVELDERCITALKDLENYDPRFTVIHDDALKLNITEVLPQTPRAVIANLPYNVATPLILDWIKTPETFDSITVLIQKEVAQRLCASPRTKLYGRLSVMTQWRAQVHISFDVPPEAFTPPPKVMSSVVHIRPRPLAPEAPSWEVMELVVKTAFAQRRKMLRKNMQALWGEETEAVLLSCDIKPTARAEELNVADFIRLSSALD